MGDAEAKRSLASRARTPGAVVLTVAWLASVLVALFGNPSKFDELLKNPHDLAEFAAGAVGPLALLWLIIGYFQQGEELELQRKQLKEQADETRRLADASSNSELHARRDNFLGLYETAQARMNVAASRTIKFINSSQVTKAYWEQYSFGDTDVFFNILTNYIGRNFEDFKEMYERSPVIHSEIDVLIDLYGFLIDSARAADPQNNTVLKLIESSGVANLVYLLTLAKGMPIKFETRRNPEKPQQLASGWDD